MVNQVARRPKWRGKRSDARNTSTRLHATNTQKAAPTSTDEISAGPEPSPRLGKRRLGTIFLIVFIDLMGFGLILPLLPFYAEAYGATAVLTGLLIASYAAAQLIGAPVLGRLSDRHGRRPVLLLSILGTALSLLLLGLAEWLAPGTAAMLGLSVGSVVLTLLFVGRTLDGLTGGNISVAQAYIADVTDEHNRAKGMGLIGAAFGLGFIIGPAAGGLLSAYGYGVPALVAAGLAVINMAMVYFLLPESLTQARRVELRAQPRPAFTLGALAAALRRPRTGELFHVRFFFGLSFSMFQSIFALYASGAPLQLTPQATGFVLTYVGVVTVLVQAVAIAQLTRRFRETQLLLWAAGLMAVSLFAWGLTPNVAVLLLVLAPLALGGGVMNTIINSLLSKSVRPDEVGGTLGLSASLESLTRVIAPTLGGYLLGQFGPLGPGLFTGLVMIWVVVFIVRKVARFPQGPRDPQSSERTHQGRMAAGAG